MPDKMFVLPTKDVCIDGIKHWWLSLPNSSLSWPNIFRWCRECGTYVTDNRAEIPAIRPNMYDRLAEVLKKRPADYVSRNIRNLKGRFLIPDENFCIVGAEKHRFKKVFEYSIDKNKKEFRVIEVCEICGTLTVAKYKYAGIIGLGTINKDKIIRSRRRMLAGSQRMNYGLVPDIFMKLEKAVPSCKVDINKNLFWWHASIYESCGWHEDMAQSPLGVSIAKPCDPSGGWTSAPSAGEHWTTADVPKKEKCFHVEPMSCVPVSWRLGHR